MGLPRVFLTTTAARYLSTHQFLCLKLACSKSIKLGSRFLTSSLSMIWGSPKIMCHTHSIRRPIFRDSSLSLAEYMTSNALS